jgi:hypothetical protein
MKSWAKIRGEMPLESQARLDARLGETLVDAARQDAKGSQQRVAVRSGSALPNE